MPRMKAMLNETFGSDSWRGLSINERQRFISNKLFDGLAEKLQTSKWAKMTKTSTDTALRDIKDLIEKGILQTTNEGGRNANYELVDFKME